VIITLYPLLIDFIRDYQHLHAYQDPPIYPGALIIQGNKDAGFIFQTFETKDSGEQVIEFYVQSLLNRGWTFRRWQKDAASFVYETSGPSYEFDVTIVREEPGITTIRTRFVAYTIEI
jgi:hypothetical protein